MLRIESTLDQQQLHENSEHNTEITVPISHPFALLVPLRFQLWVREDLCYDPRAMDRWVRVHGTDQKLDLAGNSGSLLSR